MHYSFEELIRDLGVKAERLERVRVSDNGDEFGHTTMSECYYNTAMAVASDPQRYQYSLGIAKCENGFYYPHAFIFDKVNNKYCDPTWGLKSDQIHWLYKRYSFTELIDFINEKDHPPTFSDM